MDDRSLRSLPLYRDVPELPKTPKVDEVRKRLGGRQGTGPRVGRVVRVTPTPWNEHIWMPGTRGVVKGNVALRALADATAPIFFDAGSAVLDMFGAVDGLWHVYSDHIHTRDAVNELAWYLILSHLCGDPAALVNGTDDRAPPVPQPAEMSRRRA